MSDRTDRLLADDARTPLADGGFTRRVMSALPGRAVARRSWLKPVLVLGSTALGGILAIVLSPQGGALLQGFRDLMLAHSLTPAALTSAAISGALLASALIFAADAD